MARSNSTLDKAVLRELTGTQDGGWALGKTLEAFSQGKTAAYATTKAERRAALREGARRALVAEQARKGTEVIDAAAEFDKLGMASYRTDASENRVRVDKTGLSVEIDPSSPHAAEEVNHARTMDANAPNSTGGYGTEYFINQRNEMLSAMGGITPWAFSKEGGGHNLYGDDVKAFWTDMMGRWQEHGGSSDEFVRTLDVPDNSRQIIKAYLDDMPGAREKLEDTKTWNLVASDAQPRENMAAAKGGEDRFVNGRNFLATDKVPDTIFGIPVAKAEGEWTEEDLAFFREHPEAGGYYSMGDEETPEDGSPEGAPVQADEPRVAFMKSNPTLFSHVKSFEKLRLSPYADIGGYAIGYGAHADANGNPVTAETKALADESAAATLLARDLYERREMLKTLPNWSSIPGEGKQALLDVSMGKAGILSEEESDGLWTDLRAAGKDRGKLLAAVKKHYTSYLSKDPKYREGLMNRRISGMKTFFNETFSYDGKVWDKKKGWIKK